ncbi:MAG: transposase [Hassallia sp. WJT32-NPBG1]|jgi:hypothetical protein|nr:transposase [Hassallia sp. WJT32-NPBG1]
MPEFHSVELAHWLHKQNQSFVFRQKKDTTFQEKKQKVQPLSSIEIYPGVRSFYTNVKVTQKPGFGRFNLAVYWKIKYRAKQDKEAWYLLTNLPDFNIALKIYPQRFGIEAMFKDCKSGGTALGGFADLKQVPCGYNLEASQANPDRLIRLILLIALAMTSAWLHGQRTRISKTRIIYLSHSRKK